MEPEHLDRQPPRDEAEEAEQDRLLADAGEVPDESPATGAPDPDVADA